METTMRRARVARGIARIEEDRPGATDEIDLKELNINDPSRCALGQLYGHYVDGVKALFEMQVTRHGVLNHVAHAKARDYGFEVADGESYSELTNAWRNELTARRN